MLPYADDRPETRAPLLRPSLRAVASRILDTVLHSQHPVHVRIDGARGSGRSTMLHHVGSLLTSAGHRVVSWDASQLPRGANPALDLAATLIASWSEPAKAAAALRVPLRANFDANHRDRLQPLGSTAIDALTLAWRQHCPDENPTFVLLDELDDAAKGVVEDLMHALPTLCEAAGLRVVATVQEDCHALVPKRLPQVVRPPPLYGPELAELVRSLTHAEGTPFAATHQDALSDAFELPTAVHPRHIKRSLRRLHTLLEAEAPTQSHGHAQQDHMLIQWLVATDCWPILLSTLRQRDNRWWREVRLLVDQALQRRDDPLVDRLLGQPGLPYWIVATFPHPQHPKQRGYTFDHVMHAIRTAQGRLDRWGL